MIVVGGGSAGMAAAARLAKAGHPVQLHERRSALGGRWRAHDEPGIGRVDAAPAVLGFPAPWRDLFRKSGRPLEAELARSGHELVPAAPVRYRFADGSELVLPTERGDQWDALRRAYGPAVADRWRDLVDALDDVWQTLRPLGLEDELRGRHQLSRPVRARLSARRSLAALAADVGEPHLAALVRSIAHRHGSIPEQTPAWVGVDLSVSRRFGHWQLRPVDPVRHPQDTGRTSVLTEALAGRLATRRVDVRLESAVQDVLVEDGRAVGVRTGNDVLHPAAAVVVTCDPWSLADELLPPTADRALRRGVRHLRPAVAPAVSHTLVDEPSAEVSETVELSADGLPVVTYRRPVPGGTLVFRHDHGQGRPEPGFGVAWQGFRGWLRRPPVVTGVAGLYAASPSSAGGNGPSQTVLSGALASYACHDALAAAGPPTPARIPRRA